MADGDEVWRLARSGLQHCRGKPRPRCQRVSMARLDAVELFPRATDERTARDSRRAQLEGAARVVEPSGGIWIRAVSRATLQGGIGRLAYCHGAGAPRCTLAEAFAWGRHIEAALVVRRISTPEAQDTIWLSTFTTNSVRRVRAPGQTLRLTKG